MKSLFQIEVKLPFLAFLIGLDNHIDRTLADRNSRAPDLLSAPYGEQLGLVPVMVIIDGGTAGLQLRGVLQKSSGGALAVHLERLCAVEAGEAHVG